MNQFDSNKDYYAIIGATEETDRRDLEKLYKRRAAELHPDRGGSEEGMKSLNEAYWVLKRCAATTTSSVANPHP
jgi:DnaJ-class molecular chaperone